MTTAAAARTMHTEATAQDLEQLRLLSIFHYVIAGFVALFGSLPIFHLIIGLTFMFSPEAMGGGPPPEEFPVFLFGMMFTLIPALFIAIGWGTAFLIARAGSRLRQHRSHTFCIVMAAIACSFVPLGTVLGVFTIIVLSRPGVRALFAENSSMAEVF